MPISNLSFEKKLLKHHPDICSGDRPYIDFLINGMPLSELVGGVRNSIGKFGWGNNKEYELLELKELKEAKGSRHDNKLYAVYVCPECGDEGCGALMIDIEELADTIQWKNFVWSTGENIEEENLILIDSLIFDKVSYMRALNTLEQMINI